MIPTLREIKKEDVGRYRDDIDIGKLIETINYNTRQLNDILTKLSFNDNVQGFSQTLTVKSTDFPLDIKKKKAQNRVVGALLLDAYRDGAPNTTLGASVSVKVLDNGDQVTVQEIPGLPAGVSCKVTIFFIGG